MVAPTCNPGIQTAEAGMLSEVQSSLVTRGLRPAPDSETVSTPSRSNLWLAESSGLISFVLLEMIPALTTHFPKVTVSSSQLTDLSLHW